ncbi:MAG TPA: biopolymer transporter ExbD [Kamptonema sp.]|nr:biopolymer transporter ExbD [Kamptonema sp.]
MKIHLDHPAEEARIEIVPLIDVIFCILTFFILAALQLTRQQAINVDLPKARTGQSQMREMLIVSIDDFGQTYIDQLPVNDNQLDRVLQNYRTQNPNGLMVLYAPKDAKYANVVEVLDRLREVGGDRVALATLPASAPSTTPSPLLPFNPGNIPPATNNTNPLPTPLQPGTNFNPNQQYQLPPASQGQQPLNPNQFQTPSSTGGQQPLNPNQFQSLPVSPSQQPNGLNTNPSAPAAGQTSGTTAPQQSQPSKNQ